MITGHKISLTLVQIQGENEENYMPSVFHILCSEKEQEQIKINNINITCTSETKWLFQLWCIYVLVNQTSICKCISLKVLDDRTSADGSVWNVRCSLVICDITTQWHTLLWQQNINSQIHLWFFFTKLTLLIWILIIRDYYLKCKPP